MPPQSTPRAYSPAPCAMSAEHARKALPGRARQDSMRAGQHAPARARAPAAACRSRSRRAPAWSASRARSRQRPRPRPRPPGAGAGSRRRAPQPPPRRRGTRWSPSRAPCEHAPCPWPGPTLNPLPVIWLQVVSSFRVLPLLCFPQQRCRPSLSPGAAPHGVTPQRQPRHISFAGARVGRRGAAGGVRARAHLLGMT